MNLWNHIKVATQDKALYAKAQERLDSLTKPLGSLGRLEEFARKLVGISGATSPAIDKKVIFVFAGDHGITVEGVSAYPSEVTAQMVFNFLSGGAAINVLSRHAGADVMVVDMGVNYDFEEPHGLGILAHSDLDFIPKKLRMQHDGGKRISYFMSDSLQGILYGPVLPVDGGE